MQTPNINFCLTASAAATLAAKLADSPSPSGGSKANLATPLFSRPFAYLHRTHSDELPRAFVREGRGCQDTKKERETLNKLQIDTTPVSPAILGRLDCVVVYSRIREIGMELNYG